MNEYDDEYLLEDRWVLTRLSLTLNEQKKALDEYFFDKAASCVYDFFWNDFCSNYLEIVKPVLSKKKGTEAQRRTKQKILLVVLGKVIRALHPFIPFITEALFGHLKALVGHLEKSHDPLLQEFIEAMKANCCATSIYPKADFIDETSLQEFEDASKLLHQVREMRGELQIPPQESIVIHIENPTEIMTKNIHVIEALTRIQQINFSSPDASYITSTKAIGDTIISVILPSHLIQKEIERLEKDMIKITKELEGLEAKLSVSDFVEKAPKAVVDKMMQNKKLHESSLETIKQKLDHYKKAF
jgi:valyl-tRNA synthetase